MQCLKNEKSEWALPRQAVTDFAWSSRKHEILCYPDGRLCFLLTNSRKLLSIAAFSWSDWEWYLLELIFDFLEGARNRGFTSNHPICTTSPSLDESQSLIRLMVFHFVCPSLLCSTLLYSIHFSLPITIVSKIERFRYI